VFLGKFSRTLDNKSRFSVPPAFRGSLARGAYVTQGFDRNLQVLTSEAFQEIYRTVVALNIANPLARLLLRLILGTAQESGVDANGELVIPEELKQFASLNKDIYLIGQGEYFEIWSPDLWDQQEAQLRDADANGSRFSALTVTAA
jgi:transcriptional regulator MraZ